ncbi:MAG: PfkB family carbohydrate kinase [Actinomycetota bacterium]|nr:PfkB family carbohydrate kinase [Actinomycetota bacterium]
MTGVRPPGDPPAPARNGAAAANRWEQATRLVVAGSVLVDLLVRVDALPARGSDTVAHEHHTSSGGGYNVLSTASRLGLPVAYLGKIGGGPLGRQVSSDLEQAGAAVLLGPCPDPDPDLDTGFVVGIVDADGERTFLTCPGVEAELDSCDLADVVLEPSDVVYVSGYDLAYPTAGPALGTFLRDLAGGQLVAVDPGPVAAARDGCLQRLLGRVDLFSANASEAEQLTGHRRPADSVVALADRLAPGGLAVVRSGAEGCWLARSGAGPGCHLPAYQAVAVDTTGAGDVHVGTMLARLVAGDEPEEAARLGNLAAALSVERHGGSAGPTAAELVVARHLRGAAAPPSASTP